MSYPVEPISRRTALAGLGVASAALFAGRLAALAQDATPAADFPRAGHPLNGAWHWTADILNEPAENLYAMFYPHGLCLEFDPEGGIGVGFWQPTGEHEAVVSTQYQQLAGAWNNLSGPVDTLNATNIPAPWTYQSGILRVIYAVTVTVDGDRLNASGVFDVFPVAGQAADYSQGHHRSATRIA